MARTALMVMFAVALGANGYGGSDSEPDHARKAAETYVHDLGTRDGEAVCADMTKALQTRFTDTVARANPEVSGKSCAEIMTLALRSIPYDQLKQFATAKIESVKVVGAQGSFVYRLRDLTVSGKVAKEGAAWKVSCCVPGQSA
jgi:hypothetical protein